MDLYWCFFGMVAFATAARPFETLGATAGCVNPQILKRKHRLTMKQICSSSDGLFATWHFFCFIGIFF